MRHQAAPQPESSVLQVHTCHALAHVDQEAVHSQADCCGVTSFLVKAAFELPHALSPLCTHIRVRACVQAICYVGPVRGALCFASFGSPRTDPPASFPPPPPAYPPQCAAEVEEIRAFFAGAKMLIVSYDLPVKLYLKPCPSGPVGAPVWVAEWNEQAVHARSSGASIADEMPTLWIGCVTNQVRGGTWMVHTVVHIPCGAVGKLTPP